MKISKNRKNLIKKYEENKVYDPIEAIKMLKENSYVKFEESIDVAINLRIDSNKTDQNIRGVLNLPKSYWRPNTFWLTNCNSRYDASSWKNWENFRTKRSNA